MRIGVYGGAFDPVHNTHLDLAKTVTAYLQFDRLIWVPTGAAWHKAGNLTPAGHRIRMLELAFESVAKSIRQKWLISTCEIKRQGDSYTIDTVKLLQKDSDFSGARWYLMVGTDQFNLMHTWKDWTDLLERVTLAVFDRAGVDLDVRPEVLEKADWKHIPVTPSALSSSYIRELVSKLSSPLCRPEQLDITLSEFVPPLVAEYIVQHGLYINEK